VTDLEGVVRAEVDGYEAEPDDTRGVHGESDVSRLVEILRDLACLDGVHRADDDQQHVVHQRHQEPLVLHPALQYHLDVRPQQIDPSQRQLRSCLRFTLLWVLLRPFYRAML